MFYYAKTWGEFLVRMTHDQCASSILSNMVGWILEESKLNKLKYAVYMKTLTVTKWLTGQLVTTECMFIVKDAIMTW